MKTFFAILFILCSFAAFAAAMNDSQGLQLCFGLPALALGLAYIREAE